MFLMREVYPGVSNSGVHTRVCLTVVYIPRCDRRRGIPRCDRGREVYPGVHNGGLYPGVHNGGLYPG